MSQKSCVKHENSGWIRKESTSRPNQFYYFNTKTGESRWDDESQSPTKIVDSKNVLPKSNSKSDDKTVERISSAVAKNVSQWKEKEKKILAKSRDVRKSKTPAQDRLKALMANHEKIAASIKEEITAMCNNTKTIHTSKSKPKPRGSAQTRLDDIPKKLDSVSSTNIKSSARIALNNNECIPSDPKQSVAKYKQNRLTAASNKQNKITKTKRSTRKTPAQQRLYDLQKAIIKDQLVSNKESEKTSQSHCNNALRELSSDSSRSTASSMGKNNEGDSKDSTDSVTDADIELKLVQDPMAKGEKTDVVNEDEKMDWEPSLIDQPSTEHSSAKLNPAEDQTGKVFVVPDTNIFLSSLVCVKDIIAKEPNWHIKIPYMVLQELDKLKHKDNDTVSQMASRAIHYIYENMKDDIQSRFTGQSAIEDCRHLIEILCPDDKILNCCLQLKEMNCHVTLLSNDKNLTVKAKVNHVTTLTSRLCNERYDNEDR